MQQIKVNIMRNMSGKKPTQQEFGYLQNNIWKDENIQELEFKKFATMVGKLGFHWKSALVQGGSGNDCFKEAYVLSLDFDDHITIEEFTERATDLGLAPTFMYKTFSHNTLDKKYRGNTKELINKGVFTPKKISLTKGNSVYRVKHHRWRAVWRLNQVIDNPQLKTALQLMLMEIFPHHDPSCKDLSRFWVGGRELFFYEEFNTLNLDNLQNAVISVISERDLHNANRNMKAFAKSIGVRLFNKSLFILDKSVLCENVSKNGTSPINNNIEDVPNLLNFGEEFNVIEYDNHLISLDTKAYSQKNNNNRKSDCKQMKTDKVAKLRFDSNKLLERCQLYNDFVNGKKLEHNEIYHLSCNLYEFKGYSTILEDTLKKFSYNNWANKYNTYATALEKRYTPSRCESKCKFFNECQNPLNIKEKYYEKEGSIVHLYEEKLLTLEQAQVQLSKVPNLIRNLTTNDVLCVKAVTGLGKTEMLNQLANENIIIGVTNHKLGEETYNRLKKSNPNILYVRPLNTSKMPTHLKNEIEKYYELGLATDVKFLVFEEVAKLEEAYEKNGTEFPEYYEHMQEYIKSLELIPKAETMLLTHHRISYGTTNTNIDTIILDEDFLKAFVKYSSREYADIRLELDYFREWLDKIIDPKLKVDTDIFKNKVDDFLHLINTNREKGTWFENPMRVTMELKDTRKLLTRYIKETKDRLNMDLFKVFRAEYVALKKDFIHTANGENIKELQDYKVVIMSATLDDEIHTQFLLKYLYNKNIMYKSVANTELVGEVICDCSYSHSRESFLKPTKKSSAKVDKILNSNEYKHIITFKSNGILDVKPYGKEKVAWFGACEGIDEYKGTNICVIGTPHTNSAYYEALGVLLSGKSPMSNTWKVKEVEKYGYRFPLNTYELEEDSLFTRIQLYCLYSELIQAVGRARALRYNCEVYVHSALPLPNAKVLGVKKAKDFKVIDLTEEEFRVITVEDQQNQILKELDLI